MSDIPASLTADFNYVFHNVKYCIHDIERIYFTIVFLKLSINIFVRVMQKAPEYRRWLQHSQPGNIQSF
jgi:hypothetical protein